MGNNDRPADEAAIRELLNRQVMGWDAGDPDTYASVFTPDADYVTFLGSHHRGCDEIAAAYAPLFSKLLKGTHLDTEITQLRFVTSDVAIIHTNATATKKARRRRRRHKRINTTIAVRTDGRWMLAASQTTTRRRFFEKLMYGLAKSAHRPVRSGRQIRDDLVTRRDRPPQLSPKSDAAAAYRLVYGRVDALLRGRADVAELTVPACPSWTIRNTVAHLAGVAQDVVSLDVENKGADSWTQAQVDRLERHSIDELLDRWGQMVDPVTTILARAPQPSACQLVFDALTHEHDIRGALREPESRPGDLALEVALGFVTTMGDQFIRQAQLRADV